MDGTNLEGSKDVVVAVVFQIVSMWVVLLIAFIVAKK